jgi:inner membrane protein
MSNALAHRTGAAVVIGGFLLARERQEGKSTLAPFGGSLLAAICTNIPDWLEPATHPHHRQLFHSLAFAALLAHGMLKVYEWKPETDSEKFIRFCLLTAGASYLMHLAMDFGTPRSLPMLGKI